MSDLVFPDHRTQGWFAVTDERGRPVARVKAAWTGGRFTATTPEDWPVCRGWATTKGLFGLWRVVGPNDVLSLLTVRVGLLRRRATVRLERGPRLVLRGSPWRTGFTAAAGDGPVVLTGQQRQSDYLVQVDDHVLLRPEALAVVQIWRMVRKTPTVAATTSAVVPEHA